MRPSIGSFQWRPIEGWRASISQGQALSVAAYALEASAAGALERWLDELALTVHEGLC